SESKYMFIYLAFPLFRRVPARKPTTNIAAVPITIARLVFTVLLNFTHNPEVKYTGERVIQQITNMPATTPIIACLLEALRVKNPSRSNPSIPPLKIDESAHQASSALLTFVIARAASMPITPMAPDAMYNTLIDCFSVASFLMNR